MRVLIIGGTGAFSGRITERAVAAGHEVMLYNRARRPLPGGLSVPVIQGERNALREHAEEIAAFAPEAVVDSICFRPDQAEMLCELFAGVPRVVFISSVDVYGEDVGGDPVSEERTPHPVSEYGKDKLACECLLLQRLGPAATVFRPSHILGRGFLTVSLWGRSATLVDRISAAKPVPAIDGGRNLMTPVYAGDAAEWVVRSLASPAADGQVFNAVGPQIIGQARYYEIIAEVLGAPLRLVAVPSQVFRRHFASPPQFNWHRPYSGRKAESLLGWDAQYGPEMMLRETVEHMLSAGLVKECGDDTFDDRLVELLLTHEEELGGLLAEKAAA